MSGRPFEPGNKMGKGRPPGSRNKKTIFQEALEEHGVPIIKQCKVLALKGDHVALRLVVERLVAPCTAPGNRFRLGPVRTAADLVKALPTVMQEVARGRLSAQEAEAMARTMESHRRNLDGEEFYARLRVVEQRLAERPDRDDESTTRKTRNVDDDEEELDGERVA
jgi:hypothetical protein